MIFLLIIEKITLLFYIEIKVVVFQVEDEWVLSVLFCLETISAT